MGVKERYIILKNGDVELQKMVSECIIYGIISIFKKYEKRKIE